MARNVVVTGMGVIVRDATGLPAFERWLMAGGGLPSMPAHFDTSPFRARQAYGVAPEAVTKAMAQAGLQVRDQDRACAGHGLIAACEALTMAQVTPEMRADCGIALATTSGGLMDVFDDSGQASDAAPPAAVAETIARSFGLGGPFASFSCACASSSAALSYALSRLRQGDAPMMLVGGSDRLRSADFAGFNALRAMDRESCRPFDQSRRGMVIAEGAAMLLLEDENHALARGAKPLARLLDVGFALDAHHLTHPSPDGLSRAIQQALRGAGLTPHDISYVNCHGTGTPVNDRTEIEALSAVFADEASRPLISSTKGATGHLLGSAGAIEAVITVLALNAAQAPAMASTRTPEETGFAMPGPDAPAAFQGCFGMSNSLGFGGLNSSILFQAAPNYTGDAA
jgi:3-oxoacyl-(acyl-carrier-protein) synthase